MEMLYMAPFIPLPTPNHGSAYNNLGFDYTNVADYGVLCQK